MAKVYLEASESFFVNSNAQIYGNTGNETILIGNNTAVVTLAQDVERVDLAGNASAYTYQVAGNHMKVMSGSTVVADLTVKPGQTMAFADGSAAINITGLNAVTLGGTALSTTAGAIVPATFNTAVKTSVTNGGSLGSSLGGGPTQAISAAGNFDASTGAITYNVAAPASSYTVNIANFSVSDALHFATGSALSISQASGTDGMIDIAASLASQTVLVHLTGVTTALDGAVFDVASFNVAFGTGALTA
ncbi:MAG: hypothetical protein V4724_26105 [Pseudomonadota bacterium]